MSVLSVRAVGSQVASLPPVGAVVEVTLPCVAVLAAIPWLCGTLSGFAVDAAAAGMGAVWDTV